MSRSSAGSGSAAGRLLLALAALPVLAACGGGGKDAGSGDAGDAGSTAAAWRQTALQGTASAETTGAAATGPRFDPATVTGVEYRNDAAGLTVYFPAGCERIKEQDSPGETPRAAQEYIISCERTAPGDHMLSILVLKRARGRGGWSADPRTVVEIIEQQIGRLGVRIVRQRPLEAPGIEGVEVQAVETDGAGEVWMLGLLAGTDVYLMMAWSRSGRLFDDQEIQDYFNSIRLL